MSRWVSRHKRSLIVAIFLVAVAGAYAGYRIVVAKADTGTVRYVTQTVARETLVSSVSGTGNMAVGDTYSVSSPVSGTVEQVAVKLGDTVKAGQTLFVVSADQINSQIDSAYSSYQQAQSSTLNAKAAKMQAAQKLDQLQTQEDAGQTVSDTDWTVAEDQYSAAKISYNNAVRLQEQALTDYEDAQALLQDRVVEAPHGGVVTTLAVAVGDGVSGSSASSSSSGSSSASSGGTSAASGSGGGASTDSTGGSASSGSSGSSGAAVVISALGTQRAVVTLNETDMPSVKVGQKATLTFDAITDLTLTGKVERIGVDGTVSSGVVTYDVTVRPDILDKRVLPGMTVSVAIITHVTTDALTVPSAAVKTGSDGSSSVQVLVAGAPQTRTIETGASSDSAIVVTSGLSAGDKVVTQTIDTSKNGGTTTTTSRRPGGVGGILGGGGDFGGPPGGGGFPGGAPGGR